MLVIEVNDSSRWKVKTAALPLSSRTRLCGYHEDTAAVGFGNSDLLEGLFFGRHEYVLLLKVNLRLVLLLGPSTLLCMSLEVRVEHRFRSEAFVAAGAGVGPVAGVAAQVHD